jgi:hypothetical protein
MTLRSAALGAVAGGLDRLIKIAGQELTNVRRYVKELETRQRRM